MSSDIEVEEAAHDRGSRPDPAPDRIVVTRGGTPSDDVLAAIAVAIAAAAERETAGPGAGPGTAPPAWLRAALIEGTGGPVAATPGDLDVTRAGGAASTSPSGRRR